MSGPRDFEAPAADPFGDQISVVQDAPAASSLTPPELLSAESVQAMANADDAYWRGLIATPYTLAHVARSLALTLDAARAATPPVRPGGYATPPFGTDRAAAPPVEAPKSPYRDAYEHKRQSNAGTHLFDAACYWCLLDYYVHREPGA